MAVDLNNKISMKPGFGKKLENPTFNKQKLSFSRGADSSVFNNSTSLNRTSLKDSVSKNISTTSLNRSFSTGYASSNSSVFGQRSANFRPGTHFMGVSDYTRDRSDVRTGINTSGIGYDPETKGYRSGKHDLELMTGGWTQRSERRAMQRMGMVDLSTLQETSNSGSGKKMSLLGKIGLGIAGGALAVGAGIGIAKLIKNNKAEKQESDMAKLNKLSENNTKKSAQIDTASLSKMSATELNSKMGDIDGQLNQLGKDFNTSSNAYQNLQAMTSEQQTQLDQTNDQINQTGNQISQSKNNESSSLMALNAAKSQVSMLESQLNKPGLSDIEKLAIESDIKEAKAAITQKQEQYDNAVKNTQNLESQLAELNTKADSLKASIDGLKDDAKSLEKEQDMISDNIEQASDNRAAVETALADKNQNTEAPADNKNKQA